ncbi:hypothetical protein GCM10012278_08100 [Nonomuraea glycinis]|uniref:Uncharacterized protein n=1 Tax=Nonomuraea glycinis TaxID=2047744 RepID=A0A918E248_9ACTN|nr:hypothetical protein GCM10012278_08100 [Nonomuraea glycinis]
MKPFARIAWEIWYGSYQSGVVATWLISLISYILSVARWGLAGAEAIVKLRAVNSKDDLEVHWALHLARERDRNQQACNQPRCALAA